VVVLALDTTTRVGSCAVTLDGAVLRLVATDPARSHDAQLPGALMRALDEARVALADVDVYAVATGPGSFTGLRVGIAAMQGLAFAAGRPLIGVSAFDALATYAAGPAISSVDNRISTWIDAWRGEVYAALYERGKEVQPPTVASPAAILGRIPGPSTFIGEGVATYRDLIQQTLGGRARIVDPPAPLLAGSIAFLATAAATAGHRPPPHAIRPLYVRRPDAELARDAGAL
jgi:tRNA threonylcarbamoyladenosine biosynthesis protein TsaB